MEWTYHCGTIKVGLGISKSSRPANFLTSLKSLKEVACAKKILTANQGPTGSCFQLRDGSGSGIGKNFGFGYGSGSGIGTVFFINRVLSGIENLDRVFT